MAVTAFTKTPQTLLNSIKAAIREKKVETWTLDKDGDFTHSPEQWKNKAWLTPRVEEGKLVFWILGTKTSKMSSTVYAVYHGRFIEMLLAHFDEQLGSVTASALPITGDNLGGSDK